MHNYYLLLAIIGKIGTQILMMSQAKSVSMPTGVLVLCKPDQAHAEYCVYYAHRILGLLHWLMII